MSGDTGRSQSGHHCRFSPCETESCTVLQSPVRSRRCPRLGPWLGDGPSASVSSHHGLRLGRVCTSSDALQPALQNLPDMAAGSVDSIPEKATFHHVCWPSQQRPWSDALHLSFLARCLELGTSMPSAACHRSRTPPGGRGQRSHLRASITPHHRHLLGRLGRRVPGQGFRCRLHAEH